MKLFRGKKYKYIHTRGIYLDDIRAVFFPKNFWEKYRYLGIVPYKEEGRIFDALLPLVLLMDYDSKPWWCPRWFLRFLHLFGNDNSVVKVQIGSYTDYLQNLLKIIVYWIIKLNGRTMTYEYTLTVQNE